MDGSEEVIGGERITERERGREGRRREVGT